MKWSADAEGSEGDGDDGGRKERVRGDRLHSLESTAHMHKQPAQLSLKTLCGELLPLVRHGIAKHR